MDQYQANEKPIEPSSHTKTVLFCPMEWGLGHTVRLVPLIDFVIGQGHRVVLAADGLPLRFLRSRFLDLPFVEVPFYPIVYSKKSAFFRPLIRQLPGILSAIRRNRHQLETLINEWKIDLIVTDHRYGFHHPDVPSIFITNQLWLKAPKGWTFGEPLVYQIHRFILRKFTEIWIADFPEAPGLSGKLTHPPRLPQQARFIDPVSRLQDLEAEKPESPTRFSILALISGPEPQRTLFEEEVIHLFNSSGISGLILRGKPHSEPGDFGQVIRQGNITLIDHASDAQVLLYMQQAETIICRPGNSTLSDLVALRKSAILVPTPGQTEQEYVANQLAERKLFRVTKQGNITIVENRQEKSLPTPDPKKWQKPLMNHLSPASKASSNREQSELNP